LRLGKYDGSSINRIEKMNAIHFFYFCAKKKLETHAAAEMYYDETKI